jgi:LRRFIP family
MMNNAQLDNEKQSLRYQVDLLRDEVEDLSEQNIEVQRVLKEKIRVSNEATYYSLSMDFAQHLKRKEKRKKRKKECIDQHDI